MDIMVQEAAQRLHISAQRIIISLPLAICSHMVMHFMHISAHMPHICGHIGLMRIMHFMAMSHISMQSCIMHIISADMVMPLFMHIIIVSLHIVMQLQQSSIQRCISCVRSIFIMGVFSSFGFCGPDWLQYLQHNVLHAACRAGGGKIVSDLFSAGGTD
ncbi:MAG TPA: hypothetical protein VGU46_10410 [Acidobacteriaceae bacterium]|nr:hypothetical protein [Acidobacteriaceae bacterium]